MHACLHAYMQIMHLFHNSTELRRVESSRVELRRTSDCPPLTRGQHIIIVVVAIVTSVAIAVVRVAVAVAVSQHDI